jgi:hypothetical protein
VDDDAGSLSIGPRNAPAYFTRVMQYEISKAGLGHCCVSFIDDLAIHSRTADEHIEQVAAVLDMLYGCGLRVHPEKSVFVAAVSSYLGHAVSESGLTPQEAKIKDVKEMKAPLNQSELRTVFSGIGFRA